MGAIEQIRTEIAEFAGCEGESECRTSDAQIRAYVGERLAAIDGAKITGDARELYDRLLMRCEFFNQEAFRIFDENRSPERIAAVIDADAAVVSAAKRIQADGGQLEPILKALAEAFDNRDAAMTQSK